jgi:ABC transport system ATP-binding/permease protein
VPAAILVDNVTVDFPIYGANRQSLRHTLLARTGGLIRREGQRHQRVIIRALDGVCLELREGDRFALVGHNGAGKSTLLRVLAGLRTVDDGSLLTGSTVRTAFLSQELAELPGSARVLEAVEEVARRVNLGGRDLSAAQLAEVFGFTDRRLWTPVSDLSGGERRRLQMLRLLAGEPNVLLLDEPTNDLDTDTLASLEDLLDTWPATLIVASHDRYLMERVCDTVFALYGDGRLTHLPGGVDEYLEHVSAPVRPSEPDTRAPVSASTASAAADVRAARKELARLERQVSKLQDKAAQLHERLATHATDYEKVTALDADLRAVTAEIADAEHAWLELAERVGDA